MLKDFNEFYDAYHDRSAKLNRKGRLVCWFHRLDSWYGFANKTPQKPKELSTPVEALFKPTLRATSMHGAPAHVSRFLCPLIVSLNYSRSGGDGGVKKASNTF